MVVAVGEFGRTPRLSSPQGVLGRDHWPGAQSRHGLGRRIADGTGHRRHRRPRPSIRIERPLIAQDLLATVYRHLGIDPRASIHDFTGRPIAILPDGEPIRELI